MVPSPPWLAQSQMVSAPDLPVAAPAAAAPVAAMEGPIGSGGGPGPSGGGGGGGGSGIDEDLQARLDNLRKT
jgi:hypothetical protein